MTITFHESVIPYDKTVLAKVIDDKGTTHSFRFGKDVPRSRIVSIIPIFLNAGKSRRGKRSVQE